MSEATPGRRRRARRLASVSCAASRSCSATSSDRPSSPGAGSRRPTASMMSELPLRLPRGDRIRVRRPHRPRSRATGSWRSSAFRSRTRTTPSVPCGPGSRWCVRSRSSSAGRMPRVARDPRRRPPRPAVRRPRRGRRVRPRGQRRARACRRSPSRGPSCSRTRSANSSRTCFEIEAGDPQIVKGVADPLQPFRVDQRAPRPGPAPVGARRWSSATPSSSACAAAWARASAGAAERASRRTDQRRGGRRQVPPAGRFVDEALATAQRVLELHGSPFHLDVGLPPGPQPDRVPLRDHATTPTRPTRLERLAAEIASVGLDTETRCRCSRHCSGSRPRPATSRSPPKASGSRNRSPRPRASYIDRLRRGGPTVIVAENLHWFDDATRALLTTLVEDRRPAMLVLGDLARARGRLWEAIELQPLTAGWPPRADRRAPGRASPSRTASRWPRAAAASPCTSRSSSAPAPITRPIARTIAVPVPGSVPAALYEPLVARLYATPSALPVAAAAAAAGREVDRSLLAVDDRPSRPRSSTRPAGAASRRRSSNQSPTRAQRYQFRHELLREIAYEMQPPSWRRNVHSRLCDALDTGRARRLARGRVALRARRAPRGGRGRVPADSAE